MRKELFKLRNRALHFQDIAKMDRDVLPSRWIDHFPNLKHLASKIITRSSIAETSARETRVILDKSQVFKLGGILEAKIVAANNDGVTKSYGGDYFIAILRPANQSKDGVSCPIEDHMNGTYTIKCIVPQSFSSQCFIQAKVSSN